jgi:4-hydroxy-3-methylbut-2-enyl diphosphate reductase
MGVAGEKSNDGFAVRPFRQWIAPQTAFASAEQSRRAPAMASAPKKALELLIAAPRGFCAGVDRAIRIVELAIEKYGAPVYVRHEIVHNKFVVDTLRAKGAIFVEELDEVPDGVPVVFSAHGVPKAVPAKAAERGLSYLDATCPLVSKVHRQAERLVASGRHIVFIGHAGHPEVIGTFGQVPAGSMTLIETVADVATFEPRDPGTLSFLTQTTLSVDDTAEVVAALQAKFPAILAPRGEDICYATSNRQAAIKAIANACDAVLVLGAPNSSNSLRLVEVAERQGIPARLIQRASDLDWAFLDGVGTLGITAGASAPEQLVRELIDRLAERFDVTEREVETMQETISFKLPRGLEAAA